jgi:PPOX class probable F420-dependent enzyme
VPIPDDVRSLLEGPNFAHVATILPDGGPHSVPVWLGVEGDRVTFFTQTGSRKAKNLGRDPRVAISIVDVDNPYRTAQLRGRVVERRAGEEALAAMDEISKTYTGEPFPGRGPNGVLFVIEPERVRYMELPFTHQPGA